MGGARPITAADHPAVGAIEARPPGRAAAAQSVAFLSLGRVYHNCTAVIQAQREA